MKRPARLKCGSGATALWGFAICILSARADVAFPGPDPGPATASAGRVCVLSNRVISAEWQLSPLQPMRIVDNLTGATIDQRGAELFRIAQGPTTESTNGFFVAIRLEAKQVVAAASRDGAAWTDLASYPREDFTGEPKLVRIGKMNLKAEAKDYFDPGEPGTCEIAELNPAPADLPSGRFAITARANQAATRSFPFPAGRTFVSCRIDKGTDQGLSWSPALALVWEEGTKFLLVGVRDKHPTFNLITAAGENMRAAKLATYPTFDLSASAFQPAGAPRVVTVAGGRAIEADLVSASGLRARWRAELRADANYVHTRLELSSPERMIPFSGVELSDVRVGGARTVGSVPGCPVAAGPFFFGVEMPGAQNAIGPTNARTGFGCQLAVSPELSYTFGAVIGVAPTGQLRRAFLTYLERERARPSKPFLHYNCWYDLGYGVDEKGLLDVVQQFDSELVKKRGVPVQSYLADDGWDDPGQGLWVENAKKFPAGFAGLNEKLKPLGAHLSVWISPLGGYGGDKERTAWARKMGLVPADSALDLAHPAYKAWFENRCLQLMREAGVNAFKWDKAGSGVSPHFMALLDVARHLRQQNPDVFINVTVGTWPSPFWLNHIDSTWRDGSSDVGWHGAGDDREKWLTFRDGYCRKLFVEASPLYPLNSVMHHGIVHGRAFQGAKVGKTGPDLKNEVRSYFANGASLQELYLTPSMMTSSAWDRVAEAAKWAHRNADVLADAHWVGGDPLKGEPYGYAAWSPRQGTLMIRNPGAQQQFITLDAATVFELPAGAPQHHLLTSPYPDQRVSELRLNAGAPKHVSLEPFEVLVFDAKAE